ncbi:hypothetical protein QQX98_004866 [Neonectria punicea]|uniref:Uncharacterized protein n=1 Tax=Neonectria punicea TaxID=979145 RepID=A0ABR1H788_9HYPO
MTRSNEGYILCRGSRKHWRSLIPSHHLILAIRFTDPLGALNATVSGCLGTLDSGYMLDIGGPRSTAGSSHGSAGIAISAVNLAGNAVAKVEKMEEELALSIQERDAKLDELEVKLDERDETIATLQGQLERHSRFFRKVSEKLTESEERFKKLELESNAPVLTKAQVQSMITASLPKPTPMPKETRTTTPASASKADLSPKPNALTKAFAQKPVEKAKKRPAPADQSVPASKKGK